MAGMRAVSSITELIFEFVMDAHYSCLLAHTCIYTQVLSSGYIIEDSSVSPDSTSCNLTYVHQLGSSTMPFFARDLVGVSSLLQKLYFSLRAFILS